ncbi:TetR/AcrR family transcriptional regulator C-terminal domain-containing protein [Kitasatospora viridis]|uniref:TetR family transcriptional regulator n=1 Tax=Kitasatospora viridis TaxID=281105 RepID=A0A561SFL0_9ACTN|nr:TetR/AcrR family transcriptional regulator C-terminal domain-containing protein [Kitasatospora viridis]TWF73598.1 TetR family transcriptional regulator [Kitasatospora viridis]
MDGALTREAIARAARRVLEQEGIAGLSMRKVAAELDVKAASLYWHVRNKEELLDLLADELLADAEAPPREGPWRDQFREYCVIYRQHLHGIRDSAKVVCGRFVLGPNILRLLEEQLDRLREAGFSPEDAALATYTLSAYVQGVVLQETAPLAAAETTGTSRGEIAAAAGAELRALPPDRYPNLTELADVISGPAMEARFRYGLERVLDGLEARRTAGG